MSKKGQITLFVILGVIIIGAIALGLYFRQQIVSTQTLKEVALTSELPPDLELLKEMEYYSRGNTKKLA